MPLIIFIHVTLDFCVQVCYRGGVAQHYVGVWGWPDL